MVALRRRADLGVHFCTMVWEAPNVLEKSRRVKDSSACGSMLAAGYVGLRQDTTQRQSRYAAMKASQLPVNA